MIAPQNRTKKMRVTGTRVVWLAIEVVVVTAWLVDEAAFSAPPPADWWLLLLLELL